MKTKILASYQCFTRAVFAGAAVFLAAIGSVTTAQAQFNYTTLMVPGATNTFTDGISGNYVVGTYQNSSGDFAFLYNISSNTYTTLNLPAAPSAISGDNIVGYSFVSGGPQSFLYNISAGTTTTLPKMQIFYTAAVGVSGNNVVENVQGTEPAISVIYNTSSGDFTVLNAPGAQYTDAEGIDGNNVVGYYDGTSGEFGFLYNGGSYTTFSTIFPDSISGNNILEGNILYNLSTGASTTLKVPGALTTGATGLDGNDVVGDYSTASGHYGFLATPGPPNVGYTLAHGQVQLAISGFFKSAIVQESSNLLNWVNVYTNTPPFNFTDPTGPVFPCRYYRTAMSQ